MRFTKLIDIMSANGVNSLAEIARKLKVSPQSVSNWKARDQVPYKYVVEVQNRFDLSSNGKRTEQNEGEPQKTPIPTNIKMNLHLN